MKFVVVTPVSVPRVYAERFWVTLSLIVTLIGAKHFLYAEKLRTLHSRSFNASSVT